MLAMALNATSFGILVSTKTGQFNLKGAIWVKEKLKQINKTGFILVANELSPYSLNNFMLFDCYITVACPRLSDDSQSFEKPVLDLSLFKELLQIVKK
jgi:2-(3-amino-3-carboxypropyl)histidine synthase